MQSLSKEPEPNTCGFCGFLRQKVGTIACILCRFFVWIVSIFLTVAGGVTFYFIIVNFVVNIDCSDDSCKYIQNFISNEIYYPANKCEKICDRELERESALPVSVPIYPRILVEPSTPLSPPAKIELVPTSGVVWTRERWRNCDRDGIRFDYPLNGLTLGRTASSAGTNAVDLHFFDLDQIYPAPTHGPAPAVGCPSAIFGEPQRATALVSEKNATAARAAAPSTYLYFFSASAPGGRSMAVHFTFLRRTPPIDLPARINLVIESAQGREVTSETGAINLVRRAELIFSAKIDDASDKAPSIAPNPSAETAVLDLEIRDGVDVLHFPELKTTFSTGSFFWAPPAPDESFAVASVGGRYLVEVNSALKPQKVVKVE